MDNRKAAAVERSVYLVELTLPATLRLLKNRGLRRVTVLESIKPSQKPACRLLRMIGVDVVEVEFFAGHMRTENGESIYVAARRMSGRIALKAAVEIVRSDPFLFSLNEAYGRNTIRLFVAKQIRMKIEVLIARALVSRALSGTDSVVVWLPEPGLFNENILVEALPGLDLRFYPASGFRIIDLAKSWSLDLARDLKMTLISVFDNKHSVAVDRQKTGVLTLQEDDIRADRSLRGQPHWVYPYKQPAFFDTYVVKILPSGIVTVDDEAQLAELGVKILPTSVFRPALRAEKKDKTLCRIRKDRLASIPALFNADGYSARFFIVRVASLLRQAELTGALALWINAGIFLIRETHYTFADAMQLVAPALNITTIACQYSNLGYVSPGMMATTDKFLVFSEMYKSLYQVDGIMPGELVPAGYIYDGVGDFVRDRAMSHREALRQAGAEFVVCYFDESVQDGRWGMVSKNDHLGELHILAEAVLSDAAFGVVVKSQFVRNSPSRLYPEDDLIQAAKSTGRYLELMEGVHRNDVFPTEAALVSDLCIGHKFGATACLEAAIAGVRTVILDPYGTRTLWDRIYAEADIEYETMDELMAAIGRWRSGGGDERTLGDWRPILGYFDPYQDGKSVRRLRNVLESSIRPQASAG